MERTELPRLPEFHQLAHPDRLELPSLEPSTSDNDASPLARGTRLAVQASLRRHGLRTATSVRPGAR